VQLRCVDYRKSSKLISEFRGATDVSDSQIGVPREVYAALEARAHSEGKSVAHLAGEAIRSLVM
jgi:hypothetical protein